VTTRSGRRVLSEAGRNYVEMAGWTAREARLAVDWGWSPSPTPWLRVSIKLYWPNSRRRDTHNCIKLIADGVAAGITVDDRYFLIHEERPEIDRANPRAVVTVSGEA
jgi:hypothetical protein